ncbi:MAG: serine/threonine protein kinase [Deltaproteobacteria bacterium]|nr:serine/threonine protein kinase [Deltaproteobacteria bacterium]
MRTRVLSRPAAAARAAVERATRLPAGGERYEILGEIGRGGMAVVYRARDRLLGRIVALKFVVLDPDQPADMLELFYREARAAAALNHPGIVTIYDLGAIGGRPFISMELVEGEDLLQMTARSGPLGVGEAIWVAVQAAAALEFAHVRGLVHRDIKPGNLMVSSEGALKVMDFGLAVLLRRQDRESTVSGTPAYMSPEQLAGMPLDARADVFSLAASLYELLTCQLPFADMERAAPPLPPSTLRPDIPPSVAAAIVAALDPDPALRPPSVADLAARLRAAYQESLERP